MSPARFLLDVMLGKLAVYLRMCGHDAAYALDRSVEADRALLDLARTEDRTVLTRDVELERWAERAILLRSHDVPGQLRELRGAGVTLELADPPTRCGGCNGQLEPVGGGEVTPGYAPDPTATDVWRCQTCTQYFWRGSHWADVRTTLAEL